jgi:hypothetical protein
MSSLISSYPTRRPLLSPESVFYAPEEHLFCEDWSEMRRIRLPETNLVVLKRPVPEFSGAISEILAHSTGESQTLFERGMSLDLIPAMLDDDLDLESPDSLGLYLDIRDLAEKFLSVTSAKKIGVRLERVQTDSCRLFHVDRVGVRLLTTYFGDGTEWLKNSDVNRAGLGQGNDQLVKMDGAATQVIPAGWIGLLKGERGNDGLGLVHRSPRVEAAKKKRVLLRMDTLD